MFAYCGNNPVTRSDPTGQIFGIDDAVFWISAATVLAIGALWTATMTETKDFTLPSAPSISWPKDDLKPKVDNKEKELAPAIPKDPPKESTKIYRYGGTYPGNLTPSQRDVDLFSKTGKGLSFSTVPRIGAAETTIEELNSTGIVYAVRDGLEHVSVFPVGGTLDEWHRAGSTSIWTTTIKLKVVKWSGD